MTNLGGPIRWFVDNPIAANLLMVFLLLGGALSIPGIDKQFFPEFELNSVSVSMPYRGAGPSEVEQQICMRIEEAVHDLNGVDEISSNARQGVGTVTIKAERGYDVQRLTAEVKTRVDAITTFPTDAERPVVTELSHRHHMLIVTVSGDIGERQLKELSEELRDDLSAQPNVSIVDLRSPRPYEVSVEVSEYTLRQYGLKFSDVVDAIRGSSLNLPAGTIKAREGDIQLQTRGQAYSKYEFESIPLLSLPDGTQLVVGDVAEIIDGFEDLDVRTRFNDRPSHDLHVYVTSNPNTLVTSKSVHQWVEAARERVPDGVELEIWRDSAVPFKGRATTLAKNGIGGLVLVFLVLMLFLRPLLAMWVCVGIAVAFMGTFLLLPYTGVSLNMISLMAFLLVLGIVVDDAIIVGESVHAHQSAGEAGHKGAVAGTHSVLKPVMFAVVSTMIFVGHMLILPGDMASAGVPVPVVMILALTFSLIECMWILPSHLAHMRPPQPSRFAFVRRLESIRLRFANGMTDFASNIYRPFLDRCLGANLLVSAIFLVALLTSLAMYSGGWLRSAFFPEITADVTFAEITLPEGGPFDASMKVLRQVESAALQVKEEFSVDPRFEGEEEVLGNINARARGTDVQVVIEAKSDDVDIREVSERWRELIGDIGPVEEFKLDFTFNERGKPISLMFASPSLDDLRVVSQELEQILLSYPGVYNVNDSLQSPREEIVLGLKPAAENLSVSLANLARQVREAFHGAEAQRIPRTKEDVRVMVRYPKEERISVDNLSEMRVRTPQGGEVPFDTVADVQYEPGYLKIKRHNRKRILEISAEISPGSTSPGAIVSDIMRTHLPEFQERYPGLTMKLRGELKEENEFLSAMLIYMGLSMLIVYALMAIPFRSYFQPLLVLTAVPFGVMGAIFGHALLNWQISMFSLLGVIACAGVVVNDNLVFIDKINKLRDAGYGVREALLQAGEDRFRPIILTSITTFVGLVPIMTETNMDAQFLIPMVISLAFGVLFATGITLLLVPSLYLLGEQVSARLRGRSQLAVDAADSLQDG
jgi:multidrug efflux pump subunit AcrB